METADFMNSYFGLLDKAEQLVKTGQTASAVKLLEGVPAFFADDPTILFLKAHCHQQMGNWGAAIEQWQTLLDRVPQHEAAVVNIGLCLFNHGDIELAEKRFKLAVETFPGNMEAQFNWFGVQLRAEGPGPVIAAIAALGSRAGTQVAFLGNLDKFKIRLISLYDPMELAELDGKNVLQLKGDASSSSYNLRSIYESFEPVGNDCEFGMAQRKQKAEPMGLFRWTGISAENMTRALRNNLADYDQPEHYRLEVGKGEEYLLRELTYTSHSHTFVSCSEIEAEEFLKKLRVRQTFLKRKFLEDIAAGSKIFVFKAGKGMSAAAMDELQDALMALGARKFLFVIPATAEHPGGSTLVQKGNRVLGFASDFMPRIQHPQWDSIVIATYDHFKSSSR